MAKGGGGGGSLLRIGSALQGIIHPALLLVTECVWMVQLHACLRLQQYDGISWHQLAV